ncbi:Transcriptional activator of proteases prtT [Colletotrichum orbiculare MAFF 240422]|uniref:Transcriptional activator of proteases prtT n=1 Tax=Colletotrichum orbiculare (strain 104-T / ATCC 96160 / CBS 514.97 / LARS 414 / MAFF 240422) TaxID=1213857 RepID=A0A484FTW6_COLOR|nr:Transcriptional activator of proteases prtT [Colletotrichum orbiculare MAFF 240422]
MQHDAASPKPRRRRLSDESSKRDGGGGGGSGSGKEESSRKRVLYELITCTWNDSGDTHSVSSKEAPSKPDFEGRIKHLEASIADLKTTVQMLAASVRPDVRRAIHSSRSERQPADRRGSIVEPHDTVHTAGAASVAGGSGPKAPANEDVEPADKHVYSSPAEVVRKVGSQLSGGYRRTFDVQADLVSLGILDDKTAKDLVIEFVNRRKHTLLINSEVDLAPRNRDLRHASPFLHDACCLHAMRFSEHSSSVLHRRVFEHVRLQLGQLMVASPLPLEELMGILIMSLWACSPSSPEYIDSWLLSGHCAQQAMLSINFSEILNRTKTRSSTEEDQRLVRFWANTCLVNLHWAATTGRPATVPSAYLQQCKLLLNFEEVTMRDAMVYAEIGLYLILQDKLSQRLYLAHDGECEEIAAWKARWNYLFELPAASTLRISHSIAWMILARRSLEHDQASSDQDSLSSSPRLQPADAARPEPLAQQHNELHDLMHARVCSFATDVVRAFVEMPSTRAEELPEFHRLCVAYAMLIISKYEQKSAANDGGGGGLGGSEEVLQLLQAAHKQNMVWSASSPSAIQFGLERALKKVTSRVEGARGVAGVRGGGVSLVGGATGVTPAADERAPHRPKAPSPRTMRDHPNATPSTSTWTQHNTQVREQQLPPQHGTPSSFTGNTLVPEFDGSLSLETMDFFFSGGHLGLGDNSFF